jgi:hypothetical protein
MEAAAAGEALADGEALALALAVAANLERDGCAAGPAGAL